MRCKSPETQRKFPSRNAIQASSAIAHVVECGYFLAGTVNSPGNYHWPDCRLPRPRPLWSGRCRQIGQFSFLRTNALCGASWRNSRCTGQGRCQPDLRIPTIWFAHDQIVSFFIKLHQTPFVLRAPQVGRLWLISG